MLRPVLYKTFGLIGSREANDFERSTLNPRQTQLAKLRQILEANCTAQYGMDHHFGKVKTISEFQRAVPISDYDALTPYINRIAQGDKNILTTEEPFMFATTSGTTGARKLIPITRSYLREFRRASVVSGYHLLRSFPAVASGVTISVVSPHEEGRLASGIPFGAISGRLFAEEPKLIRKYIAPIPYEVFLIKDYETRYYTLLRCALTQPVSSFYALNPSTIVLLARKLKQYQKELVADIRTGSISPPRPLPDFVYAKIAKFLPPNPRRAAYLHDLGTFGQFIPEKIWPQLSLICCWTKAAASFYLQDFPEYFGSVPICDITYGASEGRGTVSISPQKQVLAIRSHFFEFIAEDEMSSANPTALIADELEESKSYYILFTTSAGLYRYNINDIVKVVGWHNRTPILEFQHKGGNIFSFTGEKITESQVTYAMTNTAQVLGARIAFFALVPEFKKDPQYKLLVEKADHNEVSNEQLAIEFDRQLRELNVEYQDKRESGRLSDIVVKKLKPGAYDTLRRCMSEEGIPDAQIKVSHLNPKQEIKEFLNSWLY